MADHLSKEARRRVSAAGGRGRALRCPAARLSAIGKAAALRRWHPELAEPPAKPLDKSGSSA